MGFFDDVKGFNDKFAPEESKRARSKTFRHVQGMINKHAPESSSHKDVRRGRMSGNDWQAAFGKGLNTRQSLSSVNESTFDPTKYEQGLRTNQEEHRKAQYGAHLGHQAIFGGQDGGTEAPPAQPLPPVGAGTRTARQDARQRAIDTQRKRFGLSNTVGTTPLGVQGGGAPTGKKRLTGE